MPAGSSFNKEMAWEKLNVRLLKKKRKHKRAILVVAMATPVAVSILYFLIVPANIQHENRIKEETVGDHSKIVIAPSNSLASASVSIDKKGKKSTGNQIRVKKKQQPLDTVSKDDEEAARATVILTSTERDTAVTQTIVAAAPVIKKKMKVVHYNELGESAAAVPDIEKTTVASAGKPGFFGSFLKAGFYSYEESMDDTIKKQKPKRSILPFSSLISQKE